MKASLLLFTKSEIGKRTRTGKTHQSILKLRRFGDYDMDDQLCTTSIAQQLVSIIFDPKFQNVIPPLGFHRGT
jgi:hypothetical protein